MRIVGRAVAVGVDRVLESGGAACRRSRGSSSGAGRSGSALSEAIRIGGETRARAPGQQRLRARCPTSGRGMPGAGGSGAGAGSRSRSTRVVAAPDTWRALDSAGSEQREGASPSAAARPSPAVARRRHGLAVGG